jgi:thiol-disulfide isomerase/thioredoxin
MNIKGLTFARYVLAAAIAMTAALGFGQYNANPTLKIGDPAPPIKVQTWLRGQPITGFEKGKVYVLDFWATWCGGCIASFPHISTIADKYHGRVSFTSVDSYEEEGDLKGKDPAPAVAEFLKTAQGEKLTLPVCVDGPAEVMFNSWIKTLRRNGFPSTFVIDQEGKIAWVDVNLDHLDWALGQVLAKTWDRDKAAAVMQHRDKLEDMLFARLRSKEADKTKDWQTLLTASEADEKQFPDRKDAFAFYKFWALLETNPDKVPDVLESMASDPLTRAINLADAAGLTLRKNNLSVRTYSAVAKIEERLLLYEFPSQGYGGKSVSAYEQLASTYEKAGDPANAVASMEKAILMAKDQNASADQIKKLQDTLATYKAAASRSS